MQSAYHPDFGQVVQYRFERLPDTADAQVEVMVARVSKAIREDVQSDSIQQMVRRVLAAEPGANPITALWRSIKGSMRFRQDADIAQDLYVDDARKQDTIEVLIRPRDQALLIMLRGMGVEDCDGFTCFAACLLMAMGIPCALVTIAGEPEEPRVWSHIYVAAYPPGQGRVALDFSHGPYPGWEGPGGRLKEWPIDETWADRCESVGWPIAIAALGLAAFLFRRAIA